MNRRTRFLLYIQLSFVASTLGGCIKPKHLPGTLGSSYSTYSYVPLDPLPVAIKLCNSSERSEKPPVLDTLPDQTVRIAVGSYDRSGKLSFGPVSAGVAGHSYQIVLDYIASDTTSISVYMRRSQGSGDQGTPVSVFASAPVAGETYYRVWSDPEPTKPTPEKTGTYSEKTSGAYTVQQTKSQADSDIPPTDAEKVIVPVYVGIGLRLTAYVDVLEGSVNLSSLGALAAGVQAGQVSGSLVVQTLGVTGESVSTALPLPSELNQTNIQNAVLALGAIKAVIRDNNTAIAPRVLGIYNPVGGGQQVVNGIISILVSQGIAWEQRCVN